MVAFFLDRVQEDPFVPGFGHFSDHRFFGHLKHLGDLSHRMLLEKPEQTFMVG
jgi:hypothetical protein